VCAVAGEKERAPVEKKKKMELARCDYRRKKRLPGEAGIKKRLPLKEKKEKERRPSSIKSGN